MDRRLRKLIEPTIPADFVFDALQACEFRGLDTGMMLEEVGLQPALLQVSGRRVSVIDYARLIEGIIDKTGDGFLGFLDKPVPVKAFSVFAAQLAACGNLRELFRQVNRFYGLFTRQFRLRLKEQREDTYVYFEFQETCDFDYRFIYQSLLVVMLRLTHWFLGENIQPVQVTFSFDGVKVERYLAYLFACPMAFGQAHNGIHLRSELLSMPCRTTLEQVDAMLRDSTRMMLVSHNPAPFTRRVREELILRRQDAWPGIEEVAGALQMSKNLLWRKLKKEKTTFLEIRNAVKRDLALSLIERAELSVGEVAVKTGFAETSSFNKAFLGWTGQSPTAYRASLGLGGFPAQAIHTP